MFRVAGLKILGRVGTHIFYGGGGGGGGGIYNSMHFERQSPFKMHKSIIFQENLKNSRFHQ